VTVGILVRRTLPAMAITLALFVAVQIVMPQLVRPHLLAPTRSTVEISESNLAGFKAGGPNGRIRVEARASDPGAWLLSSHTVDASGHAVETIPLTPSSPACAPSQQGMSACFAEIKRLGYRQQLTYLPASRFWPLQWYETGICTVLALGLAGFCFWRIHRRLP
jgi:hypothetical protein